MIPLKPKRQAQLEEYAKRQGQDPATALDDALGTYLEWERQDFADATQGMTFRVETTATPYMCCMSGTVAGDQ